jgi:hypothetical protein
MANVNQIRVRVTGLPTGEGINTFYADDASAPPLAALRTFYAALASSTPGAITYKFPSTGNTIDIATGAVVGVWSASAPADVTCTGGSTFAAPTGAVLRWKTGFFAGGRQVIGKTFLVPLAPVCFDGSGSVAAATRAAIDAAAASLISSASSLRVFSRTNHLSVNIGSAATSTAAATLNSRKR